ncbi:MAG: hypothetical protein HC851_25030 [Acaryochloris sp. RU_4_1]|nr:hypothetical protein [Acaryochloris sp. RU_4_1]
MITTLAQISDPVGYRKSEWTRIDNPYGIHPDDFQVGMIRYNIYEVRMADRNMGTLHYWNMNGGSYTAYFAKGEIGPYRMSQEAAAIDLITYHRQKIEASRKPIKRDRSITKPIKHNAQSLAYEQVTFRPDPEFYRVGRAIASIT